MESNHYSLSFTTGSLLLQESVTVAEQFLELHNWDLVRQAVLKQNLLQARTQNTSRRICQEIISRLKTCHDSELELLVQGYQQEQRYLLWLAVCRRYQFIADFAVEILREQFISLKDILNYEDFDIFYDKKAEWHPELEKIAPATKRKLRQTLFKMMREANLLSKKNVITPVILTPNILEAIPKDKYQDILFFPIFEFDLKQWLKKSCVKEKEASNNAFSICEK